MCNLQRDMGMKSVCVCVCAVLYCVRVCVLKGLLPHTHQHTNSINESVSTHLADNVLLKFEPSYVPDLPTHSELSE